MKNNNVIEYNIIMKKPYKHLTNKERIYIRDCLQAGISVATIAENLERNKSTIHRDINRCVFKWLYNPFFASFVYLNTKQRVNKRKINKNDTLRHCIIANIIRGNSPERIAKYLNDKTNLPISTSTIYRYVHSMQGVMLDLPECLPRYVPQNDNQ
jgi:IS30 family transposase